MAFPFHTAKKFVVFLLLGLVPILIFLMLLSLGIFFGIKIGLLEMAVVSIFSVFVLMIFAFKATESPFLKMWEGSEFGAMTLDDTGKIDFFTVKYVSGNLIGMLHGQEIMERFNRKFFFYINSVFGRGKLKEEDNKLVLTLEKKDYNKSQFKTEFPILIWNKRLNTFITKEYLHDKDNKELIIALGRNYYAELQKFNQTASAITRFIVDLLGKKILGQNSWIFWLLILLIGGILIYLGWPEISKLFAGVAKSAGSTVAPLQPKLA